MIAQHSRRLIEQSIDYAIATEYSCHGRQSLWRNGEDDLPGKRERGVLSGRIGYGCNLKSDRVAT